MPSHRAPRIFTCWLVAASVCSGTARAQGPDTAAREGAELGSRPIDQPELGVESPTQIDVEVAGQPAELPAAPMTSDGAPTAEAGIPAEPDDEGIPAEPDDEGVPAEPDAEGIPAEPDAIGIAPEPDDAGYIPPEPGEGPEYDNYNPLVDSPEALRAKHWRNAGIVLVVVGSVLVGGGIAMAASDPCFLPAGNGCQVAGRNRAAATMAVPGGVMLLSGVAALSYGIIAKKRVRAQFQASRRGASIGLTYRF